MTSGSPRDRRRDTAADLGGPRRRTHSDLPGFDGEPSGSQRSDRQSLGRKSATAGEQGSAERLEVARGDPVDVHRANLAGLEGVAFDGLK